MSIIFFSTMSQNSHHRQIYFEARPYGKYLRVHAIDAETGVEVIATGLISMGEPMIRQNAKQKLEYKLRKMREGK
ncbi:hypothetical protein [Terasakiella sp. SH-1]|uniref:DUF6898 family protein n=1 Tax=Terasakiella sp. SH-1 TaxID=2560057 RepID=UPI001F0DEAAE|nr:hypothetical protein [Terasakiella sp. SH-1]